MFKRYKARLIWISMGLVLEACCFAYMLIEWKLGNSAEVLSSFLSVFALASIMYGLFFRAFYEDRLLDFDTRTKFGSLFVYFVGTFGLLLTLAMYSIMGQAFILSYQCIMLMAVSVTAWFLALVLTIHIMFKPIYWRLR